MGALSIPGVARVGIKNDTLFQSLAAWCKRNLHFSWDAFMIFKDLVGAGRAPATPMLASSMNRRLIQWNVALVLGLDFFLAPKAPLRRGSSDGRTCSAYFTCVDCPDRHRTAYVCLATPACVI